MENEPLAHTPVLPQEVCDLLNVQREDVVVDATVGAGGHARLLADRLGPEGTLIGLDVDPASLRLAEQALAGHVCRVELLHANFAELAAALDSVNVDRVDVLLADLGVSSIQLDDAARGFSFQRDGPLDMRIDPRLKATAADFVNGLKEKELGDLIYHNTQEFSARKIARRICLVRRDGRITTTERLAKIVANAVGVIDPSSRKYRIHPATRTFLALRMEVNKEIPNLNALLAVAPELLRPHGRIGVIAFHSVEDRAVKIDFRQRKKENTYAIVTKKPLIAGPEERAMNPRSRSAKLRVAVRLEGDGSEFN